MENMETEVEVIILIEENQMEMMRVLRRKKPQVNGSTLHAVYDG